MHIDSNKCQFCNGLVKDGEVFLYHTDCGIEAMEIITFLVEENAHLRAYVQALLLQQGRRKEVIH